MSEPLNRLGAITLFVEDVGRAKSFYERAFELPIVYEDDESAVFGFENMLVNLLSLTAADELIEPAQPAGAAGGARGQLTVWVEDADAACATLAARGVALLNGPTDRDWGVRTASFADPDGHIWELAQRLE